jgi:chaperone required for assembly of F1-ATPase
MKRFYEAVSVEARDEGFAVLLDGRGVKTPLRAELVMPTRAVAEAVAEEWREQREEVEPDQMPMMRYATTSIDRVKPDRLEINGIIAAFAGHDLLCYRSDEADLRQLQDDSWQPLLDWAAVTYDAKLAVTGGIMSIEQPEDALARLETEVRGFEDGELAALHTATSITGSLIVALALLRGEINVEQAWQVATVDETYQANKWGLDGEAGQRLTNMRVELEAAYRYFSLCGR